MILKHIFGLSNDLGLMDQALTKPSGGKFICIEGYWIAVGKLKPHRPSNYILTDSVRDNLRDLARIVSAGYVATKAYKVTKFTGFRFSRILQ